MKTPALAPIAAILTALATISLPLHAQSGRVQLVDRVVAVVNDEVITRYELNEQKRAVVAQLKRQGVATPPEAELDAQVLERFINEKVQLQYAKEYGIRADDEVVNASLQRIAAENKMSMQQFAAALRNDGVTIEKFRDELKNEIIINRVRDREIESRVVVTDSEIDNYLALAKAQGANQAEYQLAHILVLVPEQATPDQVETRRKRAEEALRQLKTGTPFGQIAAVFSDSNDAAQGGSLGWRQADRLPALYSDAASKLQAGQISDVLRSANGFHIVRLIDKRQGEQKAVVEQSKARHILVRVNDLVSEAEAKAKIERLRDRIAGGAKFEDVAKLGSEDGSAQKGGELGWVSPGETVPEFEAAMAKAALNTVVGPVRTQFGYHLLEVTERRSQDVTRERTRQSARVALRDRKADEAFQTWLREQRDRATVEIKLNES
ncbi:MAG TPA: peptidylprolyl isomerase [Casimicrobium huifangae]|jgi:peptidyl-prolyl cis-trans isomerase SurA|uniref:peptidylprolyl isomerase n=1 Tax=Casimicrobium huifangae TaxID=2591109 RepID=UPI0012EBF829|nr:peptidylprolyl isomerase [Casimicrobium huifangae]HOB02380.1 peptidylprolyl isomerase [Casimicrobium huifangae]HQA33113.1 peptidylprolyl isomerase [Casimicrobium huifangae]HQD64095.1 peptidylprolyl isomerase [Casimicrobium huifangae]